MKTTTPKAGSVVTAIITITLSSFALAACGGGGSLDADGQALANAIAQDMQDGGEGPYDQTETQCIGDEVVKKLGVQRLNDLGVTVETPGGIESVGAEGLSTEEANKLFDALDSCVDLKATIAEVFSSMATPEVGKCIADKLPDDVVRSLMLSQMVDEEPVAGQEEQLNEIAEECGLGG